MERRHQHGMYLSDDSNTSRGHFKETRVGGDITKTKINVDSFFYCAYWSEKNHKKTTQVYRRIWMIAYVKMMLCACLYLLEDNQGQCLGGCPCTLQVHPCCEFISWLFMETAAVVSLHSSHSGVVSRQGGLLIAHMANSTIKWAGNCFQKLDTILHLEHDVYPAKKHNVIWRKCHSPLKWDMMECVQKEAYVSTMFAHRCNGKTAAAQSGIRI